MNVDALHPILLGLAGSLVAGLATGVGALPLLLKTTWSARAQNLMLALAGGMMLAAVFFSLIAPAIVLVEGDASSMLSPSLTVGIGVVVGALALWGLHGLVPHEHFRKGREGARGPALSKHALFVLAIALHNLPEGLSVGIAYGSGISSTGHAVMLGIALQNMPEGLAVAAALVADGVQRGRAIFIALLTGLVEPVGGLIGAVAVHASEALLPFGLAFAAGAMLFVVSGEVLPETHSGGNERPATFAVVIGFVGMMMLAATIG